MRSNRASHHYAPSWWRNRVTVLTAHALNAAAHLDPAGHWKIRKIKQSRKIDGLVASVIAYSCAARAPAKRQFAFAAV